MFFVDLSYVHATGGHFEHTLWLINLFSLSFDELCVSHHAWCSRWCSITVPYKSMTCDVSFSQGSVITIFRWGGHFFIACVKISSCLHDCWCVQMSLIRRISSRTQWNCQSSPDLLVSQSLVVRSHLILFLYPVSLKTALHRSMFVNILKLILMPRQSPPLSAGGSMFSGCPSVLQSIRPCVSPKSLWTWYFTSCFGEFHQIYILVNLATLGLDFEVERSKFTEFTEATNAKHWWHE